MISVEKGVFFFIQNLRKGGVFQTWVRTWYALLLGGWGGGGGGGGVSYLHNRISYIGKTTSLYWCYCWLTLSEMRAGKSHNFLPWAVVPVPILVAHVLTHVNSLRPSDTIWRHRSGSTLAQVMACCLTAPSHYLDQCWLIISKVLWHSSEDIIIRRFEDTNQ